MREITVKRLLEPCIHGLIRPCPSPNMGLVATVSRGVHGRKEVVEVWRRNGQRIFAVNAPDFTDLNEDEAAAQEAVEVLAVEWRSDGKMLAVQWVFGQDWTITIVDVYDGKVVCKVNIGGENIVPDWSNSSRDEENAGNRGGENRRGTMSWQSHFAKPAELRRSMGRDNDIKAPSYDKLSSTLDVLANSGLERSDTDLDKLLRSSANLPRALSRLEVDVALPKLSTLPPAAATGADDDLFSTRHSIDTIFHAANNNTSESGSFGGPGGHDTVDVLLTNTRRCEMHVSMYDSFVVGKVDAALALPKGFKGLRVLQDASHPLLTTHYLVLQAVKDGPAKSSKKEPDTSLHLVALDLRFITQTGYNLPLLATKATQLQNLLRYIAQISTLLSAEVRTAFDLPRRFVENVNESLAEDEGAANFMTQSYHLIVTGTCSEKFRDWLVDQVGDRGLKRWEKAVGDCLDMIRRMAYECLLPAIERAQIVLSRLDGLSRYADTAARLGLDAKGVQRVREVLDVVNILCYDMLSDVCTEVREFAAFMRWVKWEVEVQTLGEDSERAEEMRESYTGESEVRTVLGYIESAMSVSRLMRYIRADPANIGALRSDLSGVDLMERYKKARQSTKFEDLPKLSDLLHLLAERSQSVFDATAETLRKNVLCSYVAELPGDCDAELMASSVVQLKQGDNFSVHVVSRQKHDPAKLVDVRHAVDASSGKTAADGTRIHDLLQDSYARSLTTVGTSHYIALVDNKVTGDSSISDFSFDWIAEEAGGRPRHTFDSGGMGGAMVPGQVVAVPGKQGTDRIVCLDKEGTGYVLLVDQ